MRQVTWMKTAAASDKKCLNSVCVCVCVCVRACTHTHTLKMHASTLENDNRCSSLSYITVQML